MVLNLLFFEQPLKNKHDPLTVCKFHSGVRTCFSGGFSHRGLIMEDMNVLRNPLQKLAPDR